LPTIFPAISGANGAAIAPASIIMTIEETFILANVTVKKGMKWDYRQL
jgi:hypothetical protein